MQTESIPATEAKGIEAARDQAAAKARDILRDPVVLSSRDQGEGFVSMGGGAG